MSDLHAQLANNVAIGWDNNAVDVGGAEGVISLPDVDADVSLNAPTGNPSAGGVIFVDDDGGDSELFYRGSVGAATQLTPPATGTNYVAISGVILNVSGSTQNYARFGEEIGPADVSKVRLAYAGTIVAFSVRYIHSSTAVGVGGGEQMLFQIGTISDSVAATFANVTPQASSNLTWGPADNGTFPSKTVTGLSIPVTVNDCLVVMSTETGSVTPTGADANVTIWVEGNFP